MITALDDGDVHTHDDALSLLSYAVPGARVTTAPVYAPGSLEAAASVRRYEIRVDRVGREPVTTSHVYSLPVHAGDLAASARRAADAAMRA